MFLTVLCSVSRESLKARGWEALERVKIMVIKWEHQAGASPQGKEEKATRWEIGAGVGCQCTTL